MKSSNSFSILFWVDASRAINQEAPIFVRITVDSKRAAISLKLKVPINLWDPRRNRVRGSGKKAKFINDVEVGQLKPIMDGLFVIDDIGVIKFDVGNKARFVLNSNRVKGIKFSKRV